MEDPGSFGPLSRVLWSMETLGASSGQICRPREEAAGMNQAYKLDAPVGSPVS